MLHPNIFISFESKLVPTDSRSFYCWSLNAFYDADIVIRVNSVISPGSCVGVYIVVWQWFYFELFWARALVKVAHHASNHVHIIFTYCDHGKRFRTKAFKSKSVCFMAFRFIYSNSEVASWACFVVVIVMFLYHGARLLEAVRDYLMLIVQRCPSNEFPDQKWHIGMLGCFTHNFFNILFPLGSWALGMYHIFSKLSDIIPFFSHTR